MPPLREPHATARDKGPTGNSGLSEFKKLVYDSKFTKCAEEMSFVNAIFPPFVGLVHGLRKEAGEMGVA
jgi:hypothetical protein